MTADTVYSVALLVALGAGASALAAALLARAGRPGRGRRWVAPAAVVALLALAISVGTHALLGHGPGTPEALGPGAFLAEHPAFLVALGLPVAAWAARPGAAP